MGERNRREAALALASYFIIFLLFFYPPITSATESTVSGYFESGKKTQAEDFEEEDEDREYIYQNYHIRFSQKLKDKLQYEIGSFIYNRDYTSQDSLDNISKIVHTSGSTLLLDQKNKFLKLAVKLRYKEKRYRYTPSREYDQILFSPRLSYHVKDSYSVTFSTGVNTYDYLSAVDNDQISIFSKLGARKYLFERKVLFISSYKLESTTKKRKNRQKNKSNAVFGFDYKLDIPLIYKITSRVKFGQMDTKDDDKRDEDFDYEYLQFTAKTSHKVGKKLKMFFQYQYFRKDYLTADLDHAGFHFLSNWKYRMLDDRIQVVDLSFLSKHKEVDYSLKSGNNYRKETVELKGAYKNKKNWAMTGSVQGSFYNYHDDTRDKNRYYFRLSFGKPFKKERLTLFLYLKYTFTDNKFANNTEEEAARISFEYTF
jgi:hypothetical protein